MLLQTQLLQDGDFLIKYNNSDLSKILPIQKYLVETISLGTRRKVTKLSDSWIIFKNLARLCSFQIIILCFQTKQLRGHRTHCENISWRKKIGNQCYDWLAFDALTHRLPIMGSYPLLYDGSIDLSSETFKSSCFSETNQTQTAKESETHTP